MEESDNDDLNDNLSELSTNSADETVSASSSGYEFELDPAAKLLDQEVRSGRLPRTHLFYHLVLNSLKFATEIGDATNQFHHNPVIRSFCETIKCLTCLRVNGCLKEEEGRLTSFAGRITISPYLYRQAEKKGTFTKVD